MHAVVMESLEEYLAGTLEPAERREIEAHLSTCGTCRQTISGMEEVSQLFVSFRAEEEDLEPLPGFFAGVMEQVRERKSVPAWAGFFGPSPLFGRLALASLLTVAVLGGFLISREMGDSGAPSTEAVLAQQNSPDFDSQPAEDNMLVTLTAYEH